MVGKLSPEPPSNIDNQITRADRDGQDFIIQDSDDESTVEDNGYQLLGQNELDGGVNDSEDDEDNEENQQSESHNNHNQSDEEVQETVTLFNETRSSDIQIDAEQIRSVMSNINLPSSSIPAWARSIPDGQLSSILHSHIDRLQQR